MGDEMWRTRYEGHTMSQDLNRAERLSRIGHEIVFKCITKATSEVMPKLERARGLLKTDQRRQERCR